MDQPPTPSLLQILPSQPNQPPSSQVTVYDVNSDKIWFSAMTLRLSDIIATKVPSDLFHPLTKLLWDTNTGLGES